MAGQCTLEQRKSCAADRGVLLLLAEPLAARLVRSGKVRAGDVARDMVRGGSHCIAPGCLRASLEASLAALGLETVRLGCAA